MDTRCACEASLRRTYGAARSPTPNGLPISRRERAAKAVKNRTISRAKRPAATAGWAGVMSCKRSRSVELALLCGRSGQNDAQLHDHA